MKGKRDALLNLLFNLWLVFPIIWFSDFSHENTRWIKLSQIWEWITMAFNQFLKRMCSISDFTESTCLCVLGVLPLSRGRWNTDTPNLSCIETRLFRNKVQLSVDRKKMSKYVIKGSIDFSKQEKVLYQRV